MTAIKKCVFCSKKHLKKAPRMCRAKLRVLKDLKENMTEASALRKIRDGLIDISWAAQKYYNRMRD